MGDYSALNEDMFNKVLGHHHWGHVTHFGLFVMISATMILVGTLYGQTHDHTMKIHAQNRLIQDLLDDLNATVSDTNMKVTVLSSARRSIKVDGGKSLRTVTEGEGIAQAFSDYEAALAVELAIVQCDNDTETPETVGCALYTLQNPPAG
jgi:hypothetical protein